VLGKIHEARDISDKFGREKTKFVNTIGSPESYQLRPAIIEKTRLPNEAFATLIHPDTQRTMSNSATIGNGAVIFPYVVIHNNSRVGKHTLALPFTSIGHDAELGDFSIAATGVRMSGGVTVGEAAYLGANSIYNGGIIVGDGALVGMGSVVIENVDPGTRVAGNPARVIYSRNRS
jgi:sugar O-acyltransferase (sialic acid O-acetyltransferase NeuD family)